MPIQTRAIDIDEERERLHDQMAETAEEQALYDDPEAARYQQLFARGQQLQRYREILAWVAEEWDVDSIELAGLSPGEINRINDLVDETGATERDLFVAVGTVDDAVPYLQHDPEVVSQDTIKSTQAIKQTLGEVVDTTPIPYVRWAEERINDLTHPGVDEGNGYLSLLSAKQRERKSNPENGNSTSAP